MRILKTRQCGRCDTYNRPYRITCMVCGMPMPDVAHYPTRTGAVLHRVTNLVDRVGTIALGFLVAFAVLRQGVAFNLHSTLHSMIPGLAAYGAAQLVVLVLDFVAECVEINANADTTRS